MNPITHHSTATLLVLLSLFAASNSLQAATPPTPAPHVSEGQVIALADGKPIPGATVTLTDNALGSDKISPSTSATTDAQGRFRIPTSAERIILTVQAPGFGLCSIGCPTGPDQDPLTIPLKPATSVRVHLTTPDGKPAAGVKVALQSVLDPSYGSALPASFKNQLTRQTDAAGTCTLDGLPQDARINFEIVDERYIRVLASVQTKNAQPADAEPIRLENAALIEGRLTFADTGKPAPDTRIVDYGTVDGRNGYMAYATTDAQGRYRLIQLRAGTHSIMPEVRPPLSSRYAAQLLTDLALNPGQQLKDLNLSLGPGVPIRGKVTLADTGKPVDGVTIIARPAILTPGFPAMSAESGPDGAYLLRVLPGDFTIEPNMLIRGTIHPELLPPPRPRTPAIVVVPEPNGATFDLQFTLNTVPGVKGTVVDEDGNPVEGATIRVSFESDARDTAKGDGGETLSDAAGHFTLPVAADGIKLRAYKGPLALFEPVIIAADQRDLKLVLRRSKPGSMVVHVIQGDGRPLAGADVVVSESDRSQGYAPRWGRTAADGTFLVDPVRQDRGYFVTVNAKGYANGRASANPLSGQKVDLPPITLQKTDSFLAGTVTNSAGEVITDAEVRLIGGRNPSQSVHTDARGHFRFENLVAGEKFTLYTVIGGRAGRSTSVTAGTPDVTVVHIPTVTLATPTPPTPTPPTTTTRPSGLP